MAGTDSTRGADVRRRELARIHILKGELRLTREQYEAVLWTIGRRESAAELDSFQRQAVIRHLKQRLQRETNPELGKDPDRPRNIESSAQLGKIEMQLAAGGYPWSYARAMARRMYSKERIEFCSTEELAGIITALAVNAKRRGSPER